MLSAFIGDEILHTLGGSDTLLWVIRLIIFLLMLSLSPVAFVMVLVGVMHFVEGKHEFPEPHPSNVRIGSVALIITLALIAINGIILVYKVLHFDSNVSANEGNIQMNVMLPSIISASNSILLALLFKSMIESLVPRSGKNLLMIGMISFVMSGVVTLCDTFLIMGRNAESTIPTMIIATFQAIGVLTFLISYKQTLGSLNEQCPRNYISAN